MDFKPPIKITITITVRAAGCIYYRRRVETCKEDACGANSEQTRGIGH
jgi:hypothetical protein